MYNKNMNIIPRPKSYKLLGEKDNFNLEGLLFIDRLFETEKSCLVEHFNVQTTTDLEKANIKFLYNKDIKGDESYTLNIYKETITLCAKNSAGLFYGIQSLKQLCRINDGRVEAPGIIITDSPRFTWRGAMVDTSRHFMSVKSLKKFLDLLAIHKINKFHWHLTDDQGWRIEIKKYPELTKIGSKRVLNTVKEYYSSDFYSQEDIKSIVKYAMERHIEVIPEIDIPGHSTAAIASIKELSCINEELNVATTWGVHNKILCAGKESVFTWLDDVIKEIAELFPGRYIHLGGDEALKDYWESCPLCQKRMEDEGLENTKELQSYFIKRVSKTINKYGKKVLGWEEVIEGGLADDITVFSWQGVEVGVEAANKGHDVIMCPNQSACYFDHKHLDDEDEPGWLGVCSVKDTWSFNPIAEGITEEAKKHILGVQGNTWTELIMYPKTLEYMVFPRLTALSETMWYGVEDRDWEEFKNRLKSFKLTLDNMGVNYYRGDLE